MSRKTVITIEEIEPEAGAVTLDMMPRWVFVESVFAGTRYLMFVDAGGVSWVRSGDEWKTSGALPWQVTVHSRLDGNPLPEVKPKLPATLADAEEGVVYPCDKSFGADEGLFRWGKNVFRNTPGVPTFVVFLPTECAVIAPAAHRVAITEGSDA